MMRVFVEGIGLRAPGLNGWPASRGVLTGRYPHLAEPAVVPACDLLPPAERRRAVPAVKMAMAVGGEAFDHAARDAAATATVFASSSGDAQTIHQIFEMLAEPEPAMSPTRFHNSVHNAPAGYWSIAAGSREPSTSLSCADDTFAAGLLEAAAQVTVERRCVGLIAYDLPYPPPLDAAHPIPDPFGTALVLSPDATPRTLMRLDITLGGAAIDQDREGVDREAATTLPDASLEAIRRTNPAARALPLLAALARALLDRAVPDRVVLDYPGMQQVIVVVTPC
ncbi:MAG TPA: beta-ketoacyl synthase chain length factor [Stellaceae bacterium]|nr:beta-ketoacyl synthase chain length factor [Stellaceae bacterium]